VLAAPITAHVVMCTVFVHFFIFTNRFGKSTIITGAANRKIYKKEKCGNQIAAQHLLGQTTPTQSAGVSGKGNRINPRWWPNKNIKEHRSPQCINSDRKVNLYYVKNTVKSLM
jgi:hypothetical protein